MTDVSPTDQFLLELGLEDWIPLPEAREDLEARISGDPVPVMAEALTRLVSQARIRIFRGPWNDEASHRRVPDVEVPSLLADRRWFTYDHDDDNEERLYFVNVANVRDA